MTDAGTGQLHRLHLADGNHEMVADGLGHGDGLAWDRHGRLFISDGQGGQVFVIGRPGERPVVFANGLLEPADLCSTPPASCC